ncbi:MarR family winged helix-turn-helix transcriptional regulator [Brevundimonas sp. GN22]
MTDGLATANNNGHDHDLELGGLDQALGFHLRTAQQYVAREFAARFEHLDLSPVQYSALVLIENNPGRRQADLAAVLGVRQPNLVVRIDDLVNRGLVSRSADPLDRRANSLRLTAAGKKFMTQVRKAHEQHTDSLRNVLGQQDYEKVVEILSKLSGL